ncbi:MAG: CHAT domain-containing protein [Pyrinomonadaceae bacterium]
MALPEFEKALALFRADKDRLGEAITLGLIGNCYKRFAEFPRALEYLQLALTKKRELGERAEEGKTLSHLGLLYWEMGQYPQAIEHFTRAIGLGNQLNDRILEASSRNNLGLVYDELGEYRRSLDEYNKALELYRGTNFERGVSDTIGNIGGKHLLLGEYGEALRYYQQALAIDERGNLKPGMSLDLQNIALCYIGMGRLPEALESFDRSIRLANEAGLKKEEADSQKGKGSALVQLGKYTEALKQYRQALAVYEKAGLKQQLIEGLGDLGNLELRLGDAASAENEFRRALDLSREINHPRGVTINLIALGDLEWRRKRYTEAGALYRDALARATAAGDQASVAAAGIQLALAERSLGHLENAAREAQKAAEIGRATQARPIQGEALFALGQIARAGGHHEDALKNFAAAREIVTQTGNPELSWRLDFGRGQALESLNQNDAALAEYRSAIKTIEQVRNELREDRFRGGYIEDKYQVYVALVELLLKLGRVDEAFLFAERLRARSYLDLLGRGRAPIRTEAQRQTDATLRNRIKQLQQKIEEETVKPAPDQKRQVFDLFSGELAAAERDYQSFIDDLRSSDPGYASVRALKVSTSAEIVQRLNRGTALIEYVLAENSLSIFVVRPDGLRAMTIPINAANLSARIELLRSLMTRHRTEEWKLPAERLYQTLIAPVEEAGWLQGIESLYLVPHAILHYIPFAALRLPRDRDQLLVDKYVLAYLPAAAALPLGGSSTIDSNSMLAMAPSSARLQFTQQESRSVSTFFPKRHTLLLGARATESSFKSLAGRYDVIHLATHGYFNKLNPLLSGLLLEADATDDGRLEVHEIFELQLQAQLVTLSACDTALGSGYFAEVPAGDDIVGLTRAFLFAGSPSVLATLWEVNDQSAVASHARLLQQGGQKRQSCGAGKSATRNASAWPLSPSVLLGSIRYGRQHEMKAQAICRSGLPNRKRLSGQALHWERVRLARREYRRARLILSGIRLSDVLLALRARGGRDARDPSEELEWSLVKMKGETLTPVGLKPGRHPIFISLSSERILYST